MRLFVYNTILISCLVCYSSSVFYLYHYHIILPYVVPILPVILPYGPHLIAGYIVVAPFFPSYLPFVS